MPEKVLTVKATAVVSGYNLAVSGVTISLAVNAIPTVEISCAPSENPTFSSISPNVSRATPSHFVKTYRDLSAKAEGLSETNTYLNIKIEGDEKDELTLRGWILAGVGMSAVGSTSAPYLSIVLQHPICRLTKVGSVYETEKSDVGMSIDLAIDQEGPGNVLEIMDLVYRRVSAMDSAFWPMPAGSQLAVEYRKALGRPEYLPSSYLEYDGNSMFLSQDKRFKHAIGRVVMPDSGGSVWDAIVSMPGSLMLSVVQDQNRNFTTDHLLLEPMQPWKTASITISDDRCSSTDLPGMDSFRISGVMARKLGPFAGPLGLGYAEENGNPSSAPEKEVLYVPDISGVSMSDGRIVKTNSPAVLEAAYWRDAWMGKSITEGLTDLLKLYQTGYRETLRKYCRAVYETTVLSMVQAKAGMALSFKDEDGRLILPGNTCVFMASVVDAKDKKEPLYYGYIRSVVHHLSTRGGCSTIIGMSHVRPEADYKVRGNTVIGAGAKNAAYS